MHNSHNFDYKDSFNMPCWIMRYIGLGLLMAGMLPWATEGFGGWRTEPLSHPLHAGSGTCDIDIIPSLTSTRFQSEYLTKKPFLWRGGACHWPAMTSWTKTFFRTIAAGPSHNVSVRCCAFHASCLLIVALVAASIHRSEPLTTLLGMQQLLGAGRKVLMRF